MSPAISSKSQGGMSGKKPCKSLTATIFTTNPSCGSGAVGQAFQPDGQKSQAGKPDLRATIPLDSAFVSGRILLLRLCLNRNPYLGNPHRVLLMDACHTRNDCDTCPGRMGCHCLQLTE